MKTLRAVLAIGFLLTMSSFAAAQSLQTDYDHSFNLARLRTYDFYQQTRSPATRWRRAP